MPSLPYPLPQRFVADGHCAINNDEMGSVLKLHVAMLFILSAYSPDVKFSNLVHGFVWI